MRALSLGAALALLLCAPAGASAQESSAAGLVGIGMFGRDPATTVDVGLDVVGDGYAFGIGARLRWLGGSGVRSEDWDQLSEVARLIRYLNLDRDEPVRFSLAMGELGGVALGHGTVIGGYASGLDVNHGHLGAQLTAAWRAASFEAVIDDVVAPRIIGARGSYRLGAARLGAQAAVDVSAPEMTPAMTLDMSSSSVVPIVGLDAEASGATESDRLAGTLYADLIGELRTGAGLHLGAGGSLALGEGDARLGLRVEARLGTGGYVPVWIGPLYERTRGERLEQARAGGLGGAGGMVELSARAPAVGTAAVSWATRPGLPNLVTAGLRAPYFRGVQAAVWAAAELGGQDPARGLSMEARVRLPRSMFVVLETARLYRRRDVAFEPIWIATAAIGAVLGE